LSLGDSAPDLRKLNTFGILLGTIDADNVLDENVGRARVVGDFLVGLKGFLKQTNLDTDVGNIRSIVSLELVNVTPS
jgi:hypothetical protein